ncbi:hypothetical protein [Tropicibacter naphthalenivorans]|uniref:Uncharacterized protein n=1 Tax=Tropicibacter naphthalenivorans TaxID=441103 RepID=A0A0P1GEC1_9RHOB|nr:hypothetical protein [Tropicibacter naphthalenivorans]CUH80088.1 hypothetical protein TRN7648_02808 [Tropicibacter naphthalenivorans]SMC84547.1 hypothetical protein SAMN04488093_10577 [Tropicibacter naphthalenivorans]
MVFLAFTTVASILVILGLLDIESARALGAAGIALFGFLMLGKDKIATATQNMPLPPVLTTKNAELLAATFLLAVCCVFVYVGVR